MFAVAQQPGSHVCDNALFYGMWSIVSIRVLWMSFEHMWLNFIVFFFTLAFVFLSEQLCHALCDKALFNEFLYFLPSFVGQNSVSFMM